MIEDRSDFRHYHL